MVLLGEGFGGIARGTKSNRAGPKSTELNAMGIAVIPDSESLPHDHQRTSGCANEGLQCTVVWPQNINASLLREESSIKSEQPATPELGCSAFAYGVP